MTPPGTTITASRTVLTLIYILLFTASKHSTAYAGSNREYGSETEYDYSEPEYTPTPWDNFLAKLKNSRKGGEIRITIHSQAATKQMRNAQIGVLESEDLGEEDVVGLYIEWEQNETGARMNKVRIANEPQEWKRMNIGSLIQTYKLPVENVEDAAVFEQLWGGKLMVSLRHPDHRVESATTKVENELTIDDENKHLYYQLVEIPEALVAGKGYWWQVYGGGLLVFEVQTSKALHFTEENPHWNGFLASLKRQDNEKPTSHRVGIRLHQVAPEMKGLREQLGLYGVVKNKADGAVKPGKLYEEMTLEGNSFMQHIKSESEAESIYLSSFIVALHYPQHGIHIYRTDNPATVYLGEVLQEASKATLIENKMEGGDGESESVLTYEVSCGIPLSLFYPAITDTWGAFLDSLRQGSLLGARGEAAEKKSRVVGHAIKIRLTGTLKMNCKAERTDQTIKKVGREMRDVNFGSLGLFNAKLDQKNGEWELGELKARSESSEHAFTLPIASEEAANQYYVQGYFVAPTKPPQGLVHEGKQAGGDAHHVSLTDSFPLGAVLRGNAKLTHHNEGDRPITYYEVKYSQEILFKRCVRFRLE